MSYNYKLYTYMQYQDIIKYQDKQTNEMLYDDFPSLISELNIINLLINMMSSSSEFQSPRSLRG